MDSIHQGPHFIPGSIQQGRALSDAQLAQLEAHPKAAGVQQLCFFHPDENKHITSGVTRTDLKQLENASEGLSRNNPPIIGDLLVTKARNILIANGINHRNFSPEQQIHLAHLLGQGIVSGDWAHAINSALANGNLTADLVDSIIHAKIKGWEVVLDIVHSAVGNNADLSALNASEKHQLAGLLLHEQSPISGDWIQRHAEALAAGGITHTDFQAILAKAKESADTAALEAADAKKLKDIAPKVDDKKKVDDARHPFTKRVSRTPSSNTSPGFTACPRAGTPTSPHALHSKSSAKMARSTTLLLRGCAKTYKAIRLGKQDPKIRSGHTYLPCLMPSKATIRECGTF